ncbi:MAG: SRPBCC family protein [Cyanobacteria bacterium P01_C01_bin.121]
MSQSLVYEQSVFIRANSTTVERCFTEQTLMHRWLNPALVCEPVGDWRTSVGSEFNFRLKVPLLAPTLHSVVVEREPGLVVWEFDGFFQGCDRWEAQPEVGGNQPCTTLLNRFEFTIPNPLVSFGFKTFAAELTKQDMAAQLQRLKQVAERL